MAGSVTKVILVGNLGKDPEVRHTQDGKPIVTLSLATSENWRDKTTGERARICIFWSGLASASLWLLGCGLVAGASLAARSRTALPPPVFGALSHLLTSALLAPSLLVHIVWTSVWTRLGQWEGDAGERP